jgi:RNA polymerase sigma factor (sigma-70 family)
MAGGNSEIRKRFQGEVLPHLDALYTAAFYLTGDQSRASDLCEEAMLRAYRSFAESEKGNRRAWLLGILSKAFYSCDAQPQSAYGQHGQQVLEASKGCDSRGSAGGVFPQPNADAGRKPSVPDVPRALHSLPPECKTALLLIDVEGLNYEEAARVLEVTFETIRSRVSYGRALMRAALQHSQSPTVVRTR